jgi:hypothetical protein
MKKINISRLLIIFSLFIPITIYIIGDFLGTGIQFAFFRFQDTYLGSSIIPINQELGYVIDGIIQKQSAVSIILWILGSILIIGSLLITFCNRYSVTNKLKFAGIFIFCSSFIFLISTMIQYSPLFHGPAGTAIPVGLPVLFVIGGWMYMEGRKEEAGDEVDEVQGMVEESE